jgi:hypothetical protein
MDNNPTRYMLTDLPAILKMEPHMAYSDILLDAAREFDKNPLDSYMGLQGPESYKSPETYVNSDYAKANLCRNVFNSNNKLPYNELKSLATYIAQVADYIESPQQNELPLTNTTVLRNETQTKPDKSLEQAPEQRLRIVRSVDSDFRRYEDQVYVDGEAPCTYEHVW